MNVMAFLLFSLWSGLLIVAGAALLERAGTEARIPLRWSWLAAAWLAAILPLVAMISLGEAAQGGPAGIVASLAPSGLSAEGVAGGVANGDGALEVLHGWWSVSESVLDAGAERVPSWNLSRPTVAGVWGAASLALGLLFGIAHVRLLRRVRSWPAAARLGPLVVISPTVGPATVGLFRPRVVLPRWTLGLPDDELRLIVEHEREHVRSRDNLVLWLGVIAILLCPWNPTVWLAARRLRLAAELDCDARVLGRGESVSRYGRVLLEVGSRGRLRLLTVAEMAASPSLLERRLAIMNQRFGRISPARALGLGFLGGALILAACATEAPVATRVDVGDGAAAAVTRDPDRPVVRIDADGGIALNGKATTLAELGNALAPFRGDEPMGTVTVLEASEAAPYRVIGAVQETLRRAELLRVVFAAIGEGGEYLQPTAPAAEAAPGLGVVLPDTAMPPLPTTREVLLNTLLLEVGKNNGVQFGRGPSQARQSVVLRAIPGVISQGLQARPNLIVVLRTHPDASYGTMFRALDQIQSAGATRFMLQTLDTPGA